MGFRPFIDSPLCAQPQLECIVEDGVHPGWAVAWRVEKDSSQWERKGCQPGSRWTCEVQESKLQGLARIGSWPSVPCWSQEGWAREWYTVQARERIRLMHELFWFGSISPTRGNKLRCQTSSSGNSRVHAMLDDDVQCLLPGVSRCSAIFHFSVCDLASSCAIPPRISAARGVGPFAWRLTYRRRDIFLEHGTRAQCRGAIIRLLGYGNRTASMDVRARV